MAANPLPSCIQCHALARPNILMFNDGAWIPKRSQEQEARLHRWIQLVSSRNLRLVIVEIGAGTAISTVRDFSEKTARRLSAALLRINPREPQVPPGGIAIPLGAEEALTQLLAHPQP
jgi:hypothetical protein